VLCTNKLIKLPSDARTANRGKFVAPDQNCHCTVESRNSADQLIKKLPLPLRRFIGDLSQTERILVGLELRKAAPTRKPPRDGE
jgi:hypothetical protein